MTRNFHSLKHKAWEFVFQNAARQKPKWQAKISELELKHSPFQQACDESLINS